MIMDNEKLFNLVTEGFLHKGGVVLASNNDGNVCVGIKGSLEEVTENFMNTLVKMSLIIVKKNPEDFRTLAATVVTHLLAIAKIAETEYGVPQLAEDTARLAEWALYDKDIARHATLSVKHIMKELERGVEE